MSAAGDPFALTEEPPAPPAGTAPDRAHVWPARASQRPFDAELLGRVGNGKVKVRLAGGTTFAVDRFRLHAVLKPRGQARPRLSDAALDALPWLGAGPDPLLAPRAAAAAPWGDGERKRHGAGSRASEGAAARPIAPVGSDRP